MLIGLGIIVAAGIGAVLAGYAMWWAAHRSGLVNLFSGVIFGLVAILLAVVIAWLMVLATSPT